VDIRLGGVAFIPPDPTARFSLATTEIHQAKVTRRDVLRRRSPFLRLGEPLVVTTPPPVVLDGPSLLITRSRVVQRRQRSLLHGPTVVGAPVVVVVVFSGPKVRLFRKRQPLVPVHPRYVYPIVVFASPRALGWSAISLARIRPVPVYSRLSPPVVVGP